MKPRLRVVRTAFPGRAAFDTAVSRALLMRVARGEEPETLRLYRPDSVVAFGLRDASSPGYADAIEAARRLGYQATLRLAGGRAAVFHPGTLAFGWAIPDPDPRERIHERFGEIADIVRDAFRALGVDAHVGEVAGEYCPGAHSVNARGQCKLMGVGQRLIAGAVHVGGVVAVSDSAGLRRVLEAVYAALELDWRPETAGSLSDELGDTSLAQAERALLESFARTRQLAEGALGPEVLTLASKLSPEHEAQGSTRASASA